MAKKQVSAAGPFTMSSLIDTDELLTHLLSFVEPGEFIFVGPISKKVLAKYKATVKHVHKCGGRALVKKNCTTYRSVFQSVLHVKQACAYDFPLTAWHIGYKAGQYACTNTLAYSRSCGMKWADAYNGATSKGRLQVLTWLRSRPDCAVFNPEKIAEIAAEGGYLNILRWLRA
jgi:hypothetical protein